MHLNSIKSPLQTLGLENSYDILVNVFGGGLTGQAGAIKQGAARHFANCLLTIESHKTEGHLSRDPRAKERRKYGLKKARKALNSPNVKNFIMPNPKFIQNGTPCKVICNGEVAMTTGSTP